MRIHSAFMPVRMWIGAFVLSLALPLALVGAEEPAAQTAAEEESPYEKLGWKAGPISGDLRGRAKIKVPQGFRFLEHDEASKLMDLSGNRSNGDELGFIENEKDGWAVFFEFDESGYVKDDEKNKLDSDKLMKEIRAGSKAQNEYRKKEGFAPINVVDWHVKPNFNDETKNLEWSLLLESEGERFVNYNVKVLGRHGFTEVTLVDSEEKVDKTLPEFRALLKDFSYSTGESYAEFKAGDKIAEYGLGALVLGGAAAVGYKVGFLGMIAAFFKKGAKIIIAGVVVVAVALKNTFAKLFGRRAPSDGSDSAS